MAKVEICVETARRDWRSVEPLRFVQWAGDPGWPSVPREGDNWVHCGDWTAEQVYRVFYNGPHPSVAAAVTVEFQASDDVIQHLLDAHGFVEPHPR